MNVIPASYLPHDADSAVGLERLTRPLATLAGAVLERAAAVTQAIAGCESADQAQILRERADSLAHSDPSYAADLYAVADRFSASLH